MENIFGLLIPLGCGCVLPIMAIWLIIRRKMNETNKRTQIILAAIEKNPDMDVEELMKKLSPKQKLLKEKLLTKLLWGTLTTLLGLGFIGLGVWGGYIGDNWSEDTMENIGIGLILLAIGIAFLVNFWLGKKLLASEIEAEEKQMTTQTERK